MGHDPRDGTRSLGAAPSWQVFAAPWNGLTRPAIAARRLVAGPRWAFWTSFLLQTFLLLCVVVFLALRIDQAVDNIQAGSTNRLSLLDIWHVWQSDYGIGLWIALGNVIWVPVVVAVLAWIFLPAVHRDGGVWAAYKRAFAAVSGVSGLVIALTLPIGAIITLIIDHEHDRATPAIAFAVTASIMAAHWLIAVWIARAAAAVAPKTLANEIPPRCEGCGYDLTHLPDAGRCTECGVSLDSSLEAQRRPGMAWETRRRMEDWIRATGAVLFTQRTFYRRLRMRTPLDAAHAFARRHFNTIGFAAGVWVLILSCTVGSGGDFNDPLFVVGLAIFVGLTASLAGWIAHHVIAAAVTTVCLWRRILPDTRWIRKVMCFETAYLWTFCLFNGALITLISVWGFNAFNAWLRFLPINSTLGVRGVDLLFLLGNGMLCILWLLRYRVIIGSVQWSNF